MNSKTTACREVSVSVKADADADMIFLRDSSGSCFLEYERTVHSNTRVDKKQDICTDLFGGHLSLVIGQVGRWQLGVASDACICRAFLGLVFWRKLFCGRHLDAKRGYADYALYA